MPRETTTTMMDVPTTLTERRRLEELIDLVRRTPGFDIETVTNGWRAVGGDRPLIIHQASSDDVAAVERSLNTVGWSRQIAEDHIRHLEAMYEGAYDRIPPGGYPKEDRVLDRDEIREILRWADECGCNWRPPKPGKIREYTGAMDRGEWQPYSPQCLIFSEEHNCLLDGRQRLTALLKSGLGKMGFGTITQVPIEQFRYLDQGANRSLSDILAGDKVAAGVRSKAGPAIRLVKGYESGRPWKQWPQMRYTKAQLSIALAGDYADMAHKAYDDGLTLAWDPKATVGCKMLQPVGMALSFLIRRECPSDLRAWEDFRFALSRGQDLSDGDPRLALRNQLLNRNMAVHHRYDPYLQLGASLLTWAYWRAGIKADQIRFREDQEIYPVWKPGMDLPGADPKRKVRNRNERYESRKKGPAGQS